MSDSVARLAIYLLLFVIIIRVISPLNRGKTVYQFSLASLAVLAAGEFVFSVFSFVNPNLAAFPVRNFFEIAAILVALFGCNYDAHRLKAKHLKPIVLSHIIAFLVPILFWLLFNSDLAKIMVYAYEIILFARYMINVTEKIDDTLEKPEIVLFSIGFGAFLVDLVIRLWDGKSSPLLTLYAASIVAAMITLLSREKNVGFERQIVTRDREIQIFADITKKLNSKFELNALLEGFVLEICGILDAYAAAIYIDKKLLAGKMVEGTMSGELECVAIHGFYPPPIPVNERAITKIELLHKTLKTISVEVGQGIIGRVCKDGKAELLKDLDANPEFIQTIPKVAVTKTLITMPLSRQGQVFGALQLVNRNDGENFSERDVRFADMIVDQASLAIYNTFLIMERERKLETDVDLKAAQEIQLSLIPKDLPKDTKLDIAKYFSPMRQIGGDYYDFIRIDETHLGIIIADVSGKGVTGGLVMSVMRTMMHMVAKKEMSPRAVLAELNQGIAIAVREKHMFVTVMYCVFDEANNKMTLCRAGHNPLLHVKGTTGEILSYKPDGIALGIIDSKTFQGITKEIEISYEKGDSFFLYTDGVIEEFSPTKDMFGEDRLKIYLTKNANQPSESVVSGIIQDLNDFRGPDHDQHDDIAVINIRSA
ncbi:MAG: SpoIIE family protein phosphatase [Fibrobacteres bacterium]|nr:SpoIIE family protein phosphatase [Fibrobacterota bacterium]